MAGATSTAAGGPRGAGHRPRTPRKNLLLAATIETGTLSGQVRIRNLSQTGAMLDAPILPDAGVRLVLRRAAIEMGATVVWNANGRCGIQFDDSGVSVEEWVAGARTASFDGHTGQARIDAIQAALRAGAAMPADEEPPAGRNGLSTSLIEARLVEELDYVRRLLDDLGEELVEDPAVIQEHLAAVQNLDRATQVLAHLAEILSADDRVAAAASVAMADLRTRLTRDAEG